MSVSCRILICVALSTFCSGPAFCQKISVGIVGGGALTTDFVPQTVPNTPYRAHSTSKDYVVGAMLAVSLPARLCVEVDALYRPLNFADTGVLPNGTQTTVPPETVVTWEIPILLQYKFKESHLPLTPLVEVGPSFRAAGNLNGTSPSTRGITAGAGIEAHLWKLNIAPQLRYTRWAADGAHGSFVPSTKQDQLELLVSFSI